MFYIEPNLKRFDKKIYSQFGEDGVIEAICSCLRITKGTFFEFGIGPAWNTTIESGLEGNTVLLKKNGWNGVFLDANCYPVQHEVHQEFITALNINHLYKKYNIAADLDIISIDVDGQDFWIWMAFEHRPKIVIIEYNGALGADDSITVPFDVNFVWDLTVYQGASLKAMNKLAISKSYCLVYANGVNAIFVRCDLVSNPSDFNYDEIFTSFYVHPADTKNRPWVTI